MVGAMGIPALALQFVSRVQKKGDPQAAPLISAWKMIRNLDESKETWIFINFHCCYLLSACLQAGIHVLGLDVDEVLNKMPTLPTLSDFQGG